MFTYKRLLKASTLAACGVAMLVSTAPQLSRALMITVPTNSRPPPQRTS